MGMQGSHSPDIGKLLQAAAEFVSGAKQLAVRLGIAKSLLGKLMAVRYHMTATLPHQAVDIVLANRQPLIPLAATWTSGVVGDSSQ